MTTALNFGDPRVRLAAKVIKRTDADIETAWEQVQNRGWLTEQFNAIGDPVPHPHATWDEVITDLLPLLTDNHETFIKAHKARYLFPG
jgi:hypothetical protein